MTAEAGEVIKDEKGGDDAQPFVPVPLTQEIEMAGGGGLMPGFGGGFEEPRQRDGSEKEGGCEMVAAAGT